MKLTERTPEGKLQLLDTASFAVRRILSPKMVLTQTLYAVRKNASRNVMPSCEKLSVLQKNLTQTANNVATLLNKEKGVVGNYEGIAQMNVRSNQLVTVRKHGIMQIRSLRRCLKLLT